MFETRKLFFRSKGFVILSLSLLVVCTVSSFTRESHLARQTTTQNLTKEEVFASIFFGETQFGKELYCLESASKSISEPVKIVIEKIEKREPSFLISLQESVVTKDRYLVRQLIESGIRAIGEIRIEELQVNSTDGKVANVGHQNVTIDVVIPPVFPMTMVVLPGPIEHQWFNSNKTTNKLANLSVLQAGSSYEIEHWVAKIVP